MPYEVRVMSAHRTPEIGARIRHDGRRRGLKVIIAAAGGAAHLAGVVASHTTLPVIGIPVPTELAGGLDSLLSIVQMPGDVPVATVGSAGAGPATPACWPSKSWPSAMPACRRSSRPSSTELAEKVGAKNAALQSHRCREAKDNERGSLLQPWLHGNFLSADTPYEDLETLRWVGGVDGYLRLIDQTLLPVECGEIECRDVETVREAIKTLRVRGARPSASPPPTACASGCKTAADATRRPFSPGSTRSPTTWPPAGPRRSICSGPWSG